MNRKTGRSTQKTHVVQSFSLALLDRRELVAPCSFSTELARTTADHLVYRSLYLDLTITTRGTRDNTWLVANEFADWLTSTKDLSIKASFDKFYDNPEAELDYEILWGLIIRIEANFIDLERLRLLPLHGGPLPHIFQRFRMHKPKMLEIHNLWSHWRQDHMELELKVCRVCWCFPIGRFVANEISCVADVANIETAYCILHDSLRVRISRTTCGLIPSPSVAHCAYSL
jgi:hypothetical protein